VVQTYHSKSFIVQTPPQQKMFLNVKTSYFLILIFDVKIAIFLQRLVVITNQFNFLIGAGSFKMAGGGRQLEFLVHRTVQI
jgi:hypothetical protein